MQNTAPPFSCLAFGLQSRTSPHYLTYWKFQLPLTIRIGSFWIKTYLAARFWMWWLVRDWRGWSEQNIIGSGSHGLYEQGSSKFRQTQQLSKKSGLFWRCTTETMAWGKMAPGFWWDGRAKFYMPSLHGNLHLWTLSTSLCHIDIRFFHFTSLKWGSWRCTKVMWMWKLALPILCSCNSQMNTVQDGGILLLLGNHQGSHHAVGGQLHSKGSSWKHFVLYFSWTMWELPLTAALQHATYMYSIMNLCNFCFILLWVSTRSGWFAGDVRHVCLLWGLPNSTDQSDHWMTELKNSFCEHFWFEEECQWWICIWKSYVPRTSSQSVDLWYVK